MSEIPGELTWFHDVDGNRLGVQPIQTDDGPFVRLVFPAHGIEKLLSAEDAGRAIAMLRDGIAFSEITGASSIGVSPEDF